MVVRSALDIAAGAGGVWCMVVRSALDIAAGAGGVWCMVVRSALDNVNRRWWRCKLHARASGVGCASGVDG
jgi:hypothetical protein